MNPQHPIDFRFAPSTSWTNIGLPDDSYKSLVREDGALLYGFKSFDGFSSWWFNRVIEVGILAAHGAQDVRQSTESARFPCVITTQRYAKATLELKTFAHRHDDGRRSDIVLWTILAHDDVTEFLTGLKLDIYEQNRIFTGRSNAPARVIFCADLDKLTHFDFVVNGNGTPVEDESKPGPGEMVLIDPVFSGYRPPYFVGYTGYHAAPIR